MSAKKRILESGDVALIISLMAAHESSAGVQEAGCGTLTNLAMGEKSRVTIAAKGGVDAVVRAMAAHGLSAGVQQAGCRALQNIGWNEENRVAIAAKGGIEAVVRAMAAHGSSAAVQQAGCAALTNLAANNDGIKVAIVAKDGIEAVVKAMAGHGSSVGVQEDGCWALANIASCESFGLYLIRWNAPTRVAIAAKGGIEAVVRAMAAHESSEGVQRAGCAALKNFAAYNDGNKVAIAAKDGIEAILKAMAGHGSSVGVQEDGCWALANIASCESFGLYLIRWNAETRIAIAAKGSIEAVVRAMGAHESSSGVQAAGCWALQNLALNAKNQVTPSFLKQSLKTPAFRPL